MAAADDGGSSEGAEPSVDVCVEAAKPHKEPGGQENLGARVVSGEEGPTDEVAEQTARDVAGEGPIDKSAEREALAVEDGGSEKAVAARAATEAKKRKKIRRERMKVRAETATTLRRPPLCKRTGTIACCYAVAMPGGMERNSVHVGHVGR